MSGFWKPASKQDVGSGWRDDDVSLQAPFVLSRAPLAQQRMLLPISKHKRQILYALETHGVVIVVGETGSGKSTQLTQFLMEYGWADNDFAIVCTQPRRVAAITLAQRVAQEVGSNLGDRVGYSVRFDDQTSATLTQIKYCTDGMLLREATLEDPLLSKYSVVIVDEAHERSVNSDAVLGLLKKICRKRKELRVIVCSATIDAQAFLEFFVGKTDDKPNDATIGKRKRRWGPSKSELGNDNDTVDLYKKGTIISVDGRQHSVDTLYLKSPARDYIQTLVSTAMEIHKMGKQAGDVLCFLPSAEQIDQAVRIAEEVFYDVRTTADFLPLYGSLPFHLQARIFQPRDVSNTARRFIFATNIAECSVT
jgi:ATP-dependent RNA helicase DDX35